MISRIGGGGLIGASLVLLAIGCQKSDESAGAPAESDADTRLVTIDVTGMT